jgi:organic radical activating enzyme
MSATHLRDEPKQEDIFNYIDNFEEYSTVSISGGEPGLVNLEFMKKIIFKLEQKKCEIDVNTNGEFFKKFADLDKYINSYIYHCSDKLIEDSIYIPKVDDSKIVYAITVNDTNIDNLETFIQMFTSKVKDKILIFSASNPKDQFNGNRIGINHKNKLRLLKDFRKYVDKDDYVWLYDSCINIHTDQVYL